MQILSESDTLKLEYAYETARLIEKSTGEVLYEDVFYGDPTCGLVGVDNSWAIVAGEHLAIWRANNAESISHDELRWIHALRVRDDRTVEILTDPWSKIAAVWEIDVVTFRFRKVRDFPDYMDREYSDSVDW